VNSGRRQRVLVTGAGSGIGRAVALRLAEAGYEVIATVRDPERATALSDAARSAGRSVVYHHLELSRLDEVRRFAREVLDQGGVDVVVNNAGAGVFGAVEEVDAEATAWQFAVNVFGPLELTRALLPALRARHGRVIFVGSLAGRIALPFQAHYSATKAAIAAMSDALRMELAPFGVTVTCIEPGDFATGFTDARRVVAPEASPYRAPRERCLAAIDEQERGGPDPDWVGRVVAAAASARSPAARRPVGRWARTMALALKLVPDRLRERLVKSTYRL
jgi:NAD(P)-dependent dehydrogenase (short-subunit alcohol dehydrogenase family)